MGLVLFSGAAFVQVPLTNDFNTVRAFLDSVAPKAISRPGTALEKAIRVALTAFPQDIATHRIIVLLTDGEGHEGDPVAAAKEASDANVTIYTIGLGSPGGEPIPIRDANGAISGYKKNAQGEMVVSRLDEVTLQQIASATGGQYFRASAQGQEIDAIAQAVSLAETGQRDEQFEVQGVERLAWFAGLALLALTSEILISDRKHSG
jgi:Ca-activated chloride channel family protein